MAYHLRGKEIGFQYMNFFISTQKYVRGYKKKVALAHGKKITNMQNNHVKLPYSAQKLLLRPSLRFVLQF